MGLYQVGVRSVNNIKVHPLLSFCFLIGEQKFLKWDKLISIFLHLFPDASCVYTILVNTRSSF